MKLRSKEGDDASHRRGGDDDDDDPQDGARAAPDAAILAEVMRALDANARGARAHFEELRRMLARQSADAEETRGAVEAIAARLAPRAKDGEKEEAGGGTKRGSGRNAIEGGEAPAAA